MVSVQYNKRATSSINITCPKRKRCKPYMPTYCASVMQSAKRESAMFNVFYNQYSVI